MKWPPSGSINHQRSPIFFVWKNPVASALSGVIPPKRSRGGFAGTSAKSAMVRVGYGFHGPFGVVFASITVSPAATKAIVSREERIEMAIFMS